MISRDLNRELSRVTDRNQNYLAGSTYVGGAGTSFGAEADPHDAEIATPRAAPTIVMILISFIMMLVSSVRVYHNQDFVLNYRCHTIGGIDPLQERILLFFGIKTYSHNPLTI